MAKGKRLYKPVVHPLLAAKQAADERNAYVKVAGRMGEIGNSAARKLAHIHGIQGSKPESQAS